MPVGVPRVRLHWVRSLLQVSLTPPPVDPPTGPTFAPKMDAERTVVTPRGDASFQAPTVRGGVHGDQTVVASAAVSRSEDTGPLRLGQSFGPRYHIIKVLGVGGMGAVYQAWDAELAEAVAIKVIRPEAMADPQAAWEMEKRFKRAPPCPSGHAQKCRAHP